MVLILAFLGNPPNNLPDQNSQPNYERHNAPQDERWWLVGRVVYMDDTLAQWIMMLATIAAAVLLLRTLWATQGIARETTRIGEAQTRAYLSVEKVHFFWGNDKMERPRISVTIKNSGQTPAKWFKIRVRPIVYRLADDESRGVPPPENWSDVEISDDFSGPWVGIANGETLDSTFYFPDEVDLIQQTMVTIIDTPTLGFVIVGEVQYSTFFDEEFLTQFCFGRANMRPYKVADTILEEELGIEITNFREEPIKLSRYAFPIRAYEKAS